jgi:hypothetical protein
LFPQHLLNVHGELRPVNPAVMHAESSQGNQEEKNETVQQRWNPVNPAVVHEVHKETKKKTKPCNVGTRRTWSALCCQKAKFKAFVKNEKDLFPASEQEKKPFDVVLEVVLKSNPQRQEFLQGFVAKMQSLADWNVSVNQFNEATIRISDLMALDETSDSDEEKIDTNWTLKMEALVEEELERSVGKT